MLFLYNLKIKNLIIKIIYNYTLYNIKAVIRNK